LVKRPRSHHGEPIAWGDAQGLVAEQLNVLASPHQAAGYTSGRSSNEAAFLCQLFVRNGGTNDPGCSNMGHEASGITFKQVIGIGRGSVNPGRPGAGG
jgi:anaerobic selenocysteine-containing dehydrogenase